MKERSVNIMAVLLELLKRVHAQGRVTARNGGLSLGSQGWLPRRGDSGESSQVRRKAREREEDVQADETADGC